MALFLKDFPIQNKKIYVFYQKNLLVGKNSKEVLTDEDVFYKLQQRKVFSLELFDSCTDTVTAEIDAENSDDDVEKILEEEGICDYRFIPIREYFFIATEEESCLCSRMKSYLNWIGETRFCCKCGNKLELHNQENALFCKKCGKIHFPRIEPCIILLIHKEDKVLMLRHTYRNQDRFTCLAGFMEVGESVEQCVYREVKEEVGIEITNLKYMGSQGWPFPDQLMLAFYADYKNGEIKLQESEIAEAKWFNPSEMKNPPLPGSVAWKLVNHKF